jgi:DNA-binding winged helix-turn-helix (wHTH) protein
VVCQLRRAFRDDARAPTYIETITKRGYRLIAACEVVIDVPAPAPAPAPIPVHALGAAQAGRGPQIRLMVFAGVTLASLGALSAVLLF